MFNRIFKYGLANAGLCLLLVSIGCTTPSFRDFPFFRSAEEREVSFDAENDSQHVTLTIWHDSMEAAQQESLESGKPILADFTGSDWCSWCVKLKQDVFNTGEFQDWARDNVVLLELDYPKRSIQSSAIRKQNKRLAERYKIRSYPTVLFLGTDGEVLGKLAYMKNPADWIAAANPIVSAYVSAPNSD